MVCNTHDYWGFWTFSIAWYFEKHERKQRFGKWIFPSETLCSLEYRTMDKVQEPNNSEYYFMYSIQKALKRVRLSLCLIN
jgi:hypothetical protein